MIGVLLIEILLERRIVLLDRPALTIVFVRLSASKFFFVDLETNIEWLTKRRVCNVVSTRRSPGPEFKAARISSHLLADQGNRLGSRPLGSVMRALNLSPGTGLRPVAVNLFSPAEINFTSCPGRCGAMSVNVPLTPLVAIGLPSSLSTYSVTVPFSTTNSITISSSPRPTVPPCFGLWSPCG